jgi:hypothetical protein
MNPDVLLQLIHVGVRYCVRYASVTWWTFLGSAVLCGCLIVAYQYLKKAAEATYGPPPEFRLVDAGADITRPSAALSVAKDLLWSAVILLPLVAITDYAWFVAAIVPIYAGVVAWQKFSPMLRQMRAGPESDTAPGPGNRKQRRAELRKQTKG